MKTFQIVYSCVRRAFERITSAHIWLWDRVRQCVCVCVAASSANRLQFHVFHVRHVQTPKPVGLHRAPCIPSPMSLEIVNFSYIVFFSFAPPFRLWKSYLCARCRQPGKSLHLLTVWASNEFVHIRTRFAWQPPNEIYVRVKYALEIVCDSMSKRDFSAHK